MQLLFRIAVCILKPQILYSRKLPCTCNLPEVKSETCCRKKQALHQKSFKTLVDTQFVSLYLNHVKSSHHISTPISLCYHENRTFNSALQKVVFAMVSFILNRDKQRYDILIEYILKYWSLFSPLPWCYVRRYL